MTGTVLSGADNETMTVFQTIGFFSYDPEISDPADALIGTQRTRGTIGDQWRYAWCHI